MADADSNDQQHFGRDLAVSLEFKYNLETTTFRFQRSGE